MMLIKRKSLKSVRKKDRSNVLNRQKSSKRKKVAFYLCYLLLLSTCLKRVLIAILDKPKGDKTFAEKLTTQIINNVQIKINDIHIRYEDNTTTGVPFAFGVTLSNLSVHTTNENWIQSLVAESVTRIFKVAQLEGLAVYMNCNTKLFQYDHPEDFNPLFQDTIATKTSIPEGYNYSKLFLF
jgi:hypothetical protein